MVGIELVADKRTKACFPSQERRGHQVALAARRRGVLTRPLGDVVVLTPAPAMPMELVDRLLEVVCDSIREATA